MKHPYNSGQKARVPFKDYIVCIRFELAISSPSLFHPWSRSVQLRIFGKSDKLASPKTSFRVRLSRIHFLPHRGEMNAWQKNPKDVCGEATDKHLLILHFIVILALLLLRVPSIDITLENEYLKKKGKKSLFYVILTRHAS